MHSTTRLLVPLGLSLVLITACAAAIPAEQQPPPPRNLIFLLADGMGFAQVKAYRMYADDPATDLIEPLPFDHLLLGAVATDSIILDCLPGNPANCVRDPYGITDSASSATAYATGHDTVSGQVGVEVKGTRAPTILQLAKQRGKATGIAVTSPVTHASPAPFVANVADRDLASQIADQLFDNQWEGRPYVDVLLGGGSRDLRRPDRDVSAAFGAAGYAVVGSRAELLAASGPQVLGLFAERGLPQHWDRDETSPSLADLTRKSLEILQQDPDGFFLFVEGSQVDWAGHGNDVVGVVSEMEDFSAAVEVALEFAAGRSDTLVVITADHETGGMSIGAQNQYRWDPRPMRGLDRTVQGLTQGYLAGDEPLSVFLAKELPFALTAEEQRALDAVERKQENVFAALCALFDRRTLTGWSTHVHTAVDVPLYAIGPGSETLGGTLQNEELGRRLQELFLP